jgi:hypothetical protein
MILESGEELLTVKDIAARITFDRSDDGIARTMRQVRHWTQCDLLRTTSEKHTGKGIPRLYEDEPTVEIAAILLELQRYGATVDILKHVSDELFAHWDDEGGMYILGSGTDIDVFIQVSWKSDPKTGKFIGAEVHMFDEMDDENDGGKIDNKPDSSVVINMTNVMGRISGRR